jgi:hypothetical protein
VGAEVVALDPAKVTLENFQRVKAGMDLGEVESVLGGGNPSSENDMPEASTSAASGMDELREMRRQRDDAPRRRGQAHRVSIVIHDAHFGLRCGAEAEDKREPTHRPMISTAARCPGKR